MDQKGENQVQNVIRSPEMNPNAQKLTSWNSRHSGRGRMLRTNTQGSPRWGIYKSLMHTLVSGI